MSRWPAAWAALTSRRPLTPRDVALAWMGLAILCALAYAPHVRHGGFYLDDWSNAARAFWPGGGSDAGSVVSSFARVGIYRPVLVIYVPLTYWGFGMHMAQHLAWAAALAMLAAGTLYGILRTLGVPRVHAWIIAGLTIIYPWFDSTRLWETGDQLTLSITLALAGLWVALVGLDRRSWLWHACAAFLYLLSILAYEVTLPLIAAAGLLYTMRVGWRAARVRWGVDLAVALAGGLWVGAHTVRTKSGISGDIAHLKEIITSGGVILGRTLLPVGAQRTTLALGVLSVIVAAGLITHAYRRDRSAGRAGWGLREWLLLTGGGLLVAALSWVMFIPADPYYTPSIYGVTNRVNGLAGFGLVVAAYGMFGIVGALVGQVKPKVSAIAVVVTLALGALLGLTYVHVLRRHSQIWDAAYVTERSGLDQIRSQFAHLPHRTTLFVGGYPANQTLGVPIFSATWDLNGMIKTTYDDGTLSAYPVLLGSHLTCHATGIQLEGEGLENGAGRLVSYGSAQLMDLRTKQYAKPRNLPECRAVIDRYIPGPLYLSTAY